MLLYFLSFFFPQSSKLRTIEIESVQETEKLAEVRFWSLKEMDS